MKKIYITLVALVAFCGAVFSQVTPCVINTSNSSFLSPAADSFPCIVRTLAFDSAVQVAIPSGYPPYFTIDSIDITGLSGLPTSINYQCNPPSCHFAGGSKNCISIYGTTTDTVGTYKVIIQGTATGTAEIIGSETISLNSLASLVGSSFNPSYSVSVCAPAGINDYSATLSAQISVYPNPTSGIFELALNSGVERLNGEVKVMDMAGRVVYAQQVDVVGVYSTSIDLSRFAKGLYTLQVRTGEGYASKKISVE
jgi:hypothetical protein